MFGSKDMVSTILIGKWMLSSMIDAVELKNKLTTGSYRSVDISNLGLNCYFLFLFIQYSCLLFSVECIFLTLGCSAGLFEAHFVFK